MPQTIESRLKFDALEFIPTVGILRCIANAFNAKENDYRGFGGQIARGYEGNLSPSSSKMRRDAYLLGFLIYQLASTSAVMLAYHALSR